MDTELWICNLTVGVATGGVAWFGRDLYARLIDFAILWVVYMVLIIPIVAIAIFSGSYGGAFGGFNIGGIMAALLLAAIGVFTLAGAMRLARFNLFTDQPATGWFAGIPITAAGGGMVSSVVLVLIHHPDVAASLPLHLYLPILMFVLALLMISRLRFPKAVKRDKLAVNIFQGTILAIVYYCGITRSYPEVLFGIGIFILISGIIAGRITRPT